VGGIPDSARGPGRDLSSALAVEEIGDRLSLVTGGDYQAMVADNGGGHRGVRLPPGARSTPRQSGGSARRRSPRSSTPTRLFIYLARQRVLMLVDVVVPGWVRFHAPGGATDVAGYLDAHNTALSWPFDTLVAGHLTGRSAPCQRPSACPSIVAANQTAAHDSAGDHLAIPVMAGRAAGVAEPRVPRTVLVSSSPEELRRTHRRYLE